MPGARYTRSLVCAMVVSMHTSIHSESPESSGIPRAMVYGLYRALPGDRLSCHRRLRIISANLTPAPRRQDHTSSPSALASPVKRAATSTAPRPAFVTFAKRPSEWNRMAGYIEVIWVGGQQQILKIRKISGRQRTASYLADFSMGKRSRRGGRSISGRSQP